MSQYRCRARGRTRTQALLRLACHRISVLLTMLRDGTFYDPEPRGSLDEGHRGTRTDRRPSVTDGGLRGLPVMRYCCGVRRR
ncbi:hypothetical protein CP972_00400 [Streptomyces prasinus]|uniref:IS110 family transposase n=1 Tax=Streptomyces prasinus TaxID=67345 RepID=A0ABX6AR48_9ACTN|nr:hypothetical protein CP972_00400 [Streptomyces prasinus]